MSLQNTGKCCVSDSYDITLFPQFYAIIIHFLIQKMLPLRAESAQWWSTCLARTAESALWWNTCLVWTAESAQWWSTCLAYTT